MLPIKTIISTSRSVYALGIVIATISLLFYFPIRIVGVQYNSIISLQLAIFFLCASDSHSTDYISVCEGLGNSIFYFLNPFALPDQELTPYSLALFGDFGFISGSGGSLFWGLVFLLATLLTILL